MHPLATRSADAVSALGETRLIKAIRGWLGPVSPRHPFGIGDDCAVIPASQHRQLVTVDPVIYGEHFDDTMPARATGAKLIKRNLSDIAAMGGRPRAAVVALALDRRVKTTWLAAFYRGLADIARRHHVPVVGGDISSLQGGIVATLTLIGEAPHGRVLTRRGARAGDRIYVTGTLGGSLLGHHWRFTPRLAEGAWLAGEPSVHALMDVSDGLARDIHALTPSGSEPLLNEPAIPVSTAARILARTSGKTPLQHALGDGEDYELLFAVSGRANAAAFEAKWRRRFRTRLTCIGRFARTGSTRPGDHLDLSAHRGFEHLKSQSNQRP